MIKYDSQRITNIQKYDSSLIQPGKRVRRKPQDGLNIFNRPIYSKGSER